MDTVLDRFTSIELFSASAAFEKFQETFGEAAFIAGDIWDDGDVINLDAPSEVVEGEVIRKKDRHQVRQVAVTMLIRDGEASKSMDDLDRLFIQPAAEYLKVQVGERITVPQATPISEEGLSVINPREIRLIMRYDSIKKGTRLDFTVNVLDPLIGEATWRTQ